MEKPQFIDIHSHINFAAYDEDREEVIKRARDNDVWMINVGTQRDTSKKAIELAEKYDLPAATSAAQAGRGVYAIVGIHPIHTDKSFHDEKELGSFSAKATKDKEGFNSRGEAFDESYYLGLASHPKVVGIGECGLDYYRFKVQDSGFKNSEEYKKQEKVFRQQIELAIKLDKPLMLHVRNGKGISAYKDAAAILKSYLVNHKSLKGNFHFFAGNWSEAKEILDLGFNLSFTGVITFARDYDEVIKNTPLNRIMSETDCPYVTPAPHRGKRNEPLYVREVVKKIAEIRGEEFEKVRQTLVDNALRFFNIDS